MWWTCRTSWFRPSCPSTCSNRSGMGDLTLPLPRGRGSERIRCDRAATARERYTVLALPLVLVLSACGAATAVKPEVHVAAASNLGRTLTALAAAFESRFGAHVTPSLGATAQLA